MRYFCVSNVHNGNDDDDDCSIAAESNGGCTNSTFGCTINAGTSILLCYVLMCMFFGVLVVSGGGVGCIWDWYRRPCRDLYGLFYIEDY